MLWSVLAVFVSVGVVFAATTWFQSSSTSATPPAGYSDALRKDFVSSCERADSDAACACRCAYDKVAEALPFERFRQIDRQLRNGGELPSDVSALVAGCR